jgi:chromosome segregation ATPase
LYNIGVLPVVKRIDAYQAEIEKANDLLKSEEIDKPALAKVIGNLTTQFAELDSNQAKVIDESIKRKNRIAELQAQLDEANADDGSKELDELKAKLADIESKNTELSAENKSYFESHKKQLISKIDSYKIAENEDLKKHYKGLDDTEKLTHDDVKYNLAKLSEHEDLGIFKKVSPESFPPKVKIHTQKSLLDRYPSLKKDKK